MPASATKFLVSMTRNLVDEIVKWETIWQKEVMMRYPYLFDTPDTGEDPMVWFSKCLRAELETYSDESLTYYYHDLLKAVRVGVNPAEESYKLIFSKNGYQTLGEAIWFFKLQAESKKRPN